MNCIEVSIENLNDKLNTTILKSESLNVQSFSIGSKLNTTIDRTSIELNVSCSIICDVSVI